MTFFQIIMLGASAFFAYKIYEHIQTLKDSDVNSTDSEDKPRTAEAFSMFDPEALIIRADEAYANGDYTKARALLEEINAKAPNNAETLFKLGYVFQKSGNLDAAIERFNEALALDSKDEFVHNALASAYRENKEYASARMHLNNSVEINPNNPITYFNYGNLLLDMKSKEEAIRMYEKALELNPEFVEAEQELQKLKEE